MLIPIVWLAHAQSVIEGLRAEAKALESFVSTPLAKSFLNAVESLPTVAKRTVLRDEETRTYYTSAGARARPVEKQSTLKPAEFDEKFYYYTKYGSPLAYARAVDLLGKAGLASFKDKKVCDFGYGGIGPLRLIASLGGHAVGVDVDSLLRALYSQPDDTGYMKGGGRIDLIEGFFPKDAATANAVGGGYDVFLSKNTLKRGYVHPEKEVDKRMLVDLGVSDEAFCRKVASILRKGGLFLIYNLSPAPNPADKSYLPWADGRCPFDRTTLEAAGFEVLAYDVNDDGPAREMGRRLGWDKGTSAMDFEKDLFGHYTLARKKS